jgi:SAM-dependent methyltransferase
VEETTQLLDRSAEESYEALAPVYDDFTHHHDYELWLGNLLPELRRHGLSGNRLLDVACGTGKSFLPMIARGWQVTGCDLSPSMLELARAKTGRGARLSVADMRELPVFGEFDLVWALGDAFNYQFTFDELVSALRGMKANLAPDGLLLFDINGIAQYRLFFVQTEEVERDGRRLTWRGLMPADLGPGTICEARFEAAPLSGGDDEVETHIHRQKHHTEAELLEALAEARLESLDVFGHGHDVVLERPFDDLVHTKAIYIARRT